MAVDRLADLLIKKTGDPNPVMVGKWLTYTLMVTNAFSLTATNVIVTDTLPAGTRLVTYTLAFSATEVPAF